MSINKIDARHRIKRSILTGVTPTVPPSNDFTDGTWLNTDIRAAEFFFNVPDQKLWIGTDTGSIEIPLIGGSSPTLSQVLAADNVTGSYDIVVTSNQSITSANFLTSVGAGGQLDLDYFGSPGEVSLSTDGGAQGESYLYMTPNSAELSSQYGGITTSSTSTFISSPLYSFSLADAQSRVRILAGSETLNMDDGNNRVTLNSSSATGNILMQTNTGTNQAIEIGGVKGIEILNNESGKVININNAVASGSILLQTLASANIIIGQAAGGIKMDSYFNGLSAEDIFKVRDNFSTANTTFNSVKPGIIIGSQNSTINSNISNSLIIGGYGNTLGAVNSVILGGYSNTLSSTYSIMSGSFNTDSFNTCNITSGTNNIINTAYSLLVGCVNVMDNPGIMYSNVNIAGTDDLGSNGFSSLGERTTNATPKDLSTFGQFLAIPFEIASNTAYRVHLTILATDVATGDCKEWEGFGIIKNVAGTTSLVGGTLTLTSTIADASLATATVAATADNATDSLKVTVTGIAATTINWICGIKYDKIIIA